MKRFKKCYDNNGHQWEVVINREESNITRFSGFLQCFDCGAETDDFIDKEVGINDKSIVDIIADEEEKYQIAEDDSRIQSGLN